MDKRERRYDTEVQRLKGEVLKRIAKLAFTETTEEAEKIPREIVSGRTATMRCCVYKERAILYERVALAQKGGKGHVINVIDIACEDCPVGGFEVTESCRGCIAHRCAAACPKDCISFDSRLRAHIDKARCIDCGRCASACPYNSISNRRRPCQTACKVGAISVSRGEGREAVINRKLCVSCGQCVYRCPFGAITDSSEIVNAIRLLKNSGGNRAYKLYAVIAPTVSSQFTYARLGQVITGLHKLGFFEVVEAALGADMTALAEAGELAEKGFLASSCCPAFVELVEKHCPSLTDKISTVLSPMAIVSKRIKEKTENAKIIFIGPCTAKKLERRLPAVSPYVDCVITFEELQALFDACEIDLSSLVETELDNASFFGRVFARCGGLAEAVGEALKEQGRSDFELRALSCDGLAECRAALLRAEKGMLPYNFIEGMACEGGCIGGAGCLTHEPQARRTVEEYGRKSGKTIMEAANGI